MPNTAFTIDCKGGPLVIVVDEDGLVSTPTIDVEAERSLAELGFEPHPCLVAMNNDLRENAREGHADIVALLLEAGANPQEKSNSGWTPLHWAARNGHTDVVALLLEAGVNPQKKNASGRTPLHWAAKNGHADIVVLLLEAGANPQEKDAFGRTSRHLAVLNGHTAVVALLKSWIEEHS